MNVPQEMERDIRRHVASVRDSANKISDMLNAPKGKQAVTLEDELNRLQESAYLARRAFRFNEVI